MIPLVCHQTWKTKDISKFKKYQQSLNKIKWLKKRFYTDKDIDEYVKNNLPYFHTFFKSMKRQIERVDFFRYAVMYIDGGLYCDMDVICLNPDILHKMLEYQDIVIGVERSGNRYLIGQAIIMSEPNNIFWLYLMFFIKYKYSKFKYPPYNTGPDILSAYYKYNKKLFPNIFISDFVYNIVFEHKCTGTWRYNVGHLSKLCNICRNNPANCYCYSQYNWFI